jgi:phosphate transport system substrate-binding protein
VACQATDPAETGRDAREVSRAPGARDRATLAGSGSTFVEPLLRAWIDRYRAVAPDVTIDFEATSSVRGIERLRAGEGDFVASDVPLTELEEAMVGGSGAVAQVPWAAGGIAVAYNLPDLGGPVRLTPQVLAAIFAGRIQRWDHPSIRADNEGLQLPSVPISVVFRADSSGTTAVFTAYLRAASEGGWPLGVGRAARFPGGTAVNGSGGVVAAVQRVSGAVGYVQLSHAQRASLGVALLGNRAGQFVAPTANAVSAALVNAGIRQFGTTARLEFNTDSPGAYPLATFSYVMYRREGVESDKAAALRHFAAWALTEGQRVGEAIGYAPVPRQVLVPALTAIEKG